MFFLLMFVFLPQLICCSEISRDIGGQGYEEFIIGYIDSAKSCFKPFNGSSCAPIELQQSELSTMSKSLLNNHTIIRDNQPVKLTVVPSSCDFSAVAKLCNSTKLDDNQKHYVSNILNAAKDLQLTVRKYINQEMGNSIFYVLSDFITASCKPEIFDEGNRLNNNVRYSVLQFLTNFNQACERYYLNAYDQIPIHPKIDLGIGIFLVLSLCYLYKNNICLVEQNHILDKLIFVGIYGAWLVYDFKDRIYLHMAYQVYKKKYEDLIDSQANNAYLFFKFVD